VSAYEDFPVIAVPLPASTADRTAIAGPAVILVRSGFTGSESPTPDSGNRLPDIRTGSPSAAKLRTLRRFLGGGWLPRVDPFVHRPRALLRICRSRPTTTVPDATRRASSDLIGGWPYSNADDKQLRMVVLSATQRYSANSDRHF
jgi:hypothetical protein